MVSPVIRISDETWQRLQLIAVPLEDTPDDVIKKLLDKTNVAVPARRKAVEPTSNQRLGRGAKTPQGAYRPYILKALAAAGGRAPVGPLLEEIKTLMSGVLDAADFEQLPSGTDVRWRNTAMWERLEMKNDGLLRDDSPRGWWELSDEGDKAAGDLE